MQSELGQPQNKVKSKLSAIGTWLVPGSEKQGDEHGITLVVE